MSPKYDNIDGQTSNLKHKQFHIQAEGFSGSNFWSNTYTFIIEFSLKLSETKPWIVKALKGF